MMKAFLPTQFKGETYLSDLPDDSHQTPPVADDAFWGQPETKNV